jgi:LytS/YehU family sensor histidine kinase
MLSLVALHRLFTIDYNTGVSDVIFTFLFHLPVLFAVYANLYLMRRYFLTKKYSIYSIYIVALVLLSVAIYFTIFNLIVPRLLEGFYLIAYYSPTQVLQFTVGYIAISSMLFLSSNWFFVRERQLTLERENHQVILDNLKAQINPHFLFNSLNNIYGSSSEGHVKKYLVDLSDALRYVIYDAQADFVPLVNEVEYLRNYFNLEVLRVEQSADLKFDTVGPFDQYVIAPLLLLPLVENCFQYCDKGRPQINISLEMQKDTFIFKTTNNVGLQQPKDSGGLGLTNVQKRLELIYPQKSKFIYGQTLQEFTLNLSIDMTSE